MDEVHTEEAAAVFMSEGWDTFDKVFDLGDGPLDSSLASPSDGNLPSLLEDSTSIDALLDEPEIVQECRSGNIRLQERLCAPEALRVLVEYITSEPLGVPEMSARRRPYVAAELLSCDCLLEALLLSLEPAPDPALPSLVPPLSAPHECASVAGPSVAHILWGFLDSEPGAATAPVLAGYFCAIAASLFLRGPEKVALFLQHRGAVRLLERFVLWLEFRCVAELLTLLLCGAGPQQVFPSDSVVGPLLECLGAPRHAWLNGSTAKEHAALVLDALLSRAVEGDLHHGGEELLVCLSAADIVTSLVQQVTCPGADAAVAAAVAALLSSALAQTHGLQPDLRFPPRGPELRSSFDLVLASPGSEQVAEGSAASDIVLAGKLDIAGSALVSTLCAQLPQLAAQLPGDGAVQTTLQAQAKTDSSDLEEAIRALLRLRRLSLSEEGHDQEDVELTAQLLELGRRSPELQEVLQRRGWSMQHTAEQALDEILVELHRADGAALGINFEGSDTGTDLRITKIREGLVMDHNEAHPELRVRVGDRLVAVNGCGGEGDALRLHDALRSGEVLQLRVRRLQDREANAPELSELLADLRRMVQQRRAAMIGSSAIANSDPASPSSTAGGAVTIEILRLLSLLARTGRVGVLDAFAHVDVVPRCLRALFACRWSSVLHCAATAVLTEVIRSRDRERAVQLLLTLVDRPEMRELVAVLQAARTAREALLTAELESAADGLGRAASPQAGSLGALRWFSKELCECAAEAPEVAEALSGIDGWTDVVSEVEYSDRLRDEPLGGPLPATEGAFDCLAAVRAAVASASAHDADFSLEDMRDLHEEMDVTDLIQMSDLQRRRRAKATGESLESHDPLGEELEGLEALSLGRPCAPLSDFDD